MLFILMCAFLSFATGAQELIGAWEATYESDDGTPLQRVVIFADGYHASATYHAETGAFVNAKGGSWERNGNTLQERIEFDTETPQLVGTDPTYTITLTDNYLTFDNSDLRFRRIDDGTPGALQGAWLMSGRVRDGETQTRDTNRPRKTMKILSGTRFQWIAYNTETKEFMGSGGGTYTTNDGNYVEQIEFFSRDDNKVGLRLPFSYERIDTTWHHQGFSSKGDPMHEIWSIRK